MKTGCDLCPHYCRLSEGKTGICRMREYRDGTIIDTGYGRLSALSMDPIEKKPLYHFFPGEMILSAGFYGCNFKCPFCQNHTISQSKGRDSAYCSPEDLINTALEKKSFGIAFTYSEPLIHYEYLRDTSILAKEKGLKTVLISNGYINSKYGDTLLDIIDGANIDLKSFNPDFYKKELGGDLEPVCDFIRAASKKIHLEVTTLIIEGKNDSIDEMNEIALFLSGLNVDIPLHLSAYYPNYLYNVPATKPGKIVSLVAEAGKHLNYVYPGNISGGDSNTCCSNCGNVLIERTGYLTRKRALHGNACRFCGTPVPIVC